MGLHLEKGEYIRTKGIHDKIKLQLLEIHSKPVWKLHFIHISESGNPNKTGLSYVKRKNAPFSCNVDCLLYLSNQWETEREAHHAS